MSPRLVRALILSIFANSLLLNAAGFVHHATAEYGYITLLGHGVYLSPEAMADRNLMNRAIAQLDADLKKAHAILPPAALRVVAGVAFWIEGDNPELKDMAYHGLRSRAVKKRGYNPDKAGAIEIGHLRKYVNRGPNKEFTVLHELSHAFQNRVEGADALVQWAFDQAVASRRYEKSVRGGRTQRAYALESSHEYFAELSQAYWARNDFYPFTRADLAEFDPTGYAAIEKVWALAN